MTAAVDLFRIPFYNKVDSSSVTSLRKDRFTRAFENAVFI